MQNHAVTSSYSMRDEEEKFEYVVGRIQEIYNFEPESEDELIRYREFIRHVILMYQKAELAEKIGDQ